MKQAAISQEVTAGETQAAKAGRRKHGGVIILLQALIALGALAAAVYGLLLFTSAMPGAAPAVPEQIGGYPLIDAVRGEAAIAEMREMHGKDIGISGGWIGYYQDKAIAWVGTVQDEGRAFQLLDAMNRRIRVSNGPFTNLQEFQVDGQTIFTVVGQGQRHYYYQQGKLVIWLAAPRGGEERFVREALKIIR